MSPESTRSGSERAETDDVILVACERSMGMRYIVPAARNTTNSAEC